MSAVLISPLRLSLLTLCFLLSACAATSTNRTTHSSQWSQLLHDEWFKPREQTAPLIPADQIFVLSPIMASSIAEVVQRNPDPSDRMRYLVDTVFGPEFKDFEYISGKTTAAALTYQQRGGNCLSLSIMTLVMAEALGFKPQLQEVKVPLMWERRGNTDFVNRHVNILVRRPVNITVNTLDFSRDVILDFEPHNVSSVHAERVLDRKQITAMFYNNLGAEAFVTHDLDLAYQYYREALQYNPSFDSAWINLAQLYNHIHQPEAAELALRNATLLAPENYVAMSALHKQYLRQQRIDDARLLEKTLASLRENDPYFLFGRAMKDKRNQHYRDAAKHLEKAIKVSEGFEIMHRELADIYRKLGKNTLADEQLKTADAIAQTLNLDLLTPQQHD